MSKLNLGLEDGEATETGSSTRWINIIVVCELKFQESTLGNLTDLNSRMHFNSTHL